MHLQLRLELLDPPASRPQLLPLLRAQPRQLAPINQLLPPPAIDRLVADLQQPRDLPHRPPGRDQIQRPPTKLSRIPLPTHTTSSRGRPSLETGPHGTGAGPPLETWRAPPPDFSSQPPTSLASNVSGTARSNPCPDSHAVRKRASETLP